MCTNYQVSGRVCSVLSFLAIIALVTVAMTSPAFSQAPVRITQPIDESNLVTLSGNTRPEANLKNDRGRLPEGYNLDHILLVLQRSPQQEAEVEAFVDSLTDKSSPNYHHWLTAEEFGERFGVAQQDIDTVAGWLVSQGFMINQVYASRMMIDFSGNAGQVRQAFHADIHYLEVNGESHIANMNDPMVPAALAPVIKAIFSLHNFNPHKMLKPKPDYTFSGCASSTDVPTEPGTCYAMTPADNWVIYNVNPLLSAGISGQGQTIALVEDSDSYGSDWQSYRNTFGLAAAYPQGNLVTAHPGGCTDPGANGDDSEADLDVEIASAIAPSATIELISCADGTVTFGGLTALQNLLNGSAPYPNVVSVSYGECEAFNGNGGNAAFFNTYEQAAIEGVSVFGASGDEGASSCSANFGTATAEEAYQLTSLGVSGWTDTPYNVAVGGTDFEDVYNSKTGQNGGAPLSNYWSSTNSGNYGSALQYVPEIPWNDSCASTLISEVAHGNFTTYGSSGTCNTSPFDTTSSYLTQAAGSGGASNCAIGAGGTNTGEAGISEPECQGYSKPSWQSAYGVPSDQLRDIPDVSMFAANGVWGHYEVVCWSDPNYSSDGSAPCTGAPSTWSGFGGTSVASPTAAAIQALVNQKTGENWGNPNSIYYQIAQGEYGTQGGTFQGSSCNSSTGSGGSCAFNDVTQGDIDLPCEDNGSAEKAHCYLPSGTYGVDSTDVVTGATVLWGGSGYTSAPTCAIAGPTNNSAYVSPTGTTLYSGGTQASCTATVSSSTTTAAWTVAMESTDGVGDTIILTNGPLGGSTACGPYTISGSSTTTMASGLVSSIGSSCSLASATSSHGTVTITARTAGAAGNFITEFGPATEFNFFYVYITNSTKGQGPNYVNGITVTGGGSGYQPEAPITLSGGGGTGAVAVANTTPATASSSYQPAYGAAPGWDMATGLGTVNATNMVCNLEWANNASTTGVSSSLNPSTYGQAVSFTATVAASCPAAPTGTVQFNIDGSAFGSPVTLSNGSATSGSISTLTVGTHTVTAVYSGDSNNQGSTGTLSGGQVVQIAGAGNITVASNQNPSTYGQLVTFTATIPGQYNLLKKRHGNPEVVTGSVTWSSNTGCGTTPVTSGNPGTATCSTSSLPAGSDTVTANYSGDSNHNPGSGSTTQNVNQASTTTGVQSSLDPSTYGQSVYFTASVAGVSPTGTVQFNIDGSAFGSPVTLTNGMASSGTTNSLTVGTHTVTATYSGDGNNTGSTGTLNGGQVVQIAGAGNITVASNLNPSTYSASVTFTASIPGQYNLLKKRHGNPEVVTGTVTWSSNTGCGTTNVTPGNPGTATCTTSSLPTGSDTVTANYSGDSNHNPGSGSTTQTVNQAATTIDVTSVSPASEAYGQDAAVTITAVLSWTSSGAAPTAADVTIGGNGPSGYGTTTCGSPSGDTITCTATYTPNSNDTVGTYTESASFSGDTNYTASNSPETNNFSITAATTTTGVALTSGTNPSPYGQPVTFTATIGSEYNNVTRKTQGKGGFKPLVVTGNVTWSSFTGCGTTPVTPGNNGTATAACTTSSLKVGTTDHVKATYSGDSNHSGSSGEYNDMVVSQAATTIDVTNVSPASEVYGQDAAVTITALLSWSGNGTAPTAASVTISGNGNGTYGSPSCGPASSDTITCTATYTFNSGNPDPVGTYTETASFSGDTSYTASSSPETNNFSITIAGPGNITVSSNQNPSTYGQSVTFTASIPGQYNLLKKRHDNPEVVTGTVTWSANTGCGTTPVTSGNPGTATCTTSIVPAGSDTVTANYSGDSNHNPGSGSTGQTVNQAATSLSVTSVSPSSEVYGQDQGVTITAVLSWAGSGAAPTAANVTIGGSGPSGYGATNCGNPSGDTITCTATYNPTTADVPGSYTESASFSGDTNYTSSSSPQTNNFTITQATSTTTVSSSQNPSVYGQSVTFTASISGEYNEVKGRNSRGKRLDITGTVTWSANTGCGTTPVSSGNPGTATCATSTLPVGTNTITANYSGDSNHSGSTGTLNGGQVVTGNNPTSINVTGVSPASEIYGQDAAVTITAVLSWTGSGTPPTAANVKIGGSGPSSYGATSCGNPGGDTMTCTATYTPTAADIVGTYTEAASFSGDGNYRASSSPQTNNFTITQATSTTSVSSNLNPSTYGQSVTFTATIDSEYNEVKGRNTRGKRLDITGSVTWSANTGCGTTPVTTGNPGTATCTTSSLNAGTDTITASYSGDPNHSGSTGTLQGGQVVNKATQSITVQVPAPSTAIDKSSFTIEASASSELPVTFTATGSCTNNASGTYTINKTTGTCTETMNQPGNSNYLAASQVQEQTTVVAPVTPTVSFTGAPAEADGGSNFTVTASSNETGPYAAVPSITATGSCTVGPESNNGPGSYQATVTVTNGSGMCTTKAMWGLTVVYAAASATQKTTAERITPTASFTGAPATADNGTPFTVYASSNESGQYATAPTITTTGPCSIGPVTGGPSTYQATVTMTENTGTCTMKADWAETILYKSTYVLQHTKAEP